MTIAPVTLLTLGAGGLLCPCHMVSADAEVNGIPSALYTLEGEREGEVGEERMGRRRKGHTSRASSGSECLSFTAMYPVKHCQYCQYLLTSTKDVRFKEKGEAS